MYVIVEIAGQQFKAEKGRKLYVHRLQGEENSSVSFDKVLLADNDGQVFLIDCSERRLGEVQDPEASEGRQSPGLQEKAQNGISEVQRPPSVSDTGPCRGNCCITFKTEEKWHTRKV